MKTRAKSLSKTTVSKGIALLALLSFMVLMLVKPSYYLASATKGLTIFATSVLPSLFPFYFCSLLLTYMGAVDAISRLGEKPIRKLYNTPKESAYALFLSMLCGYPVGASTICELYQCNIFDTDDAKAACAFCSTSGPIFMIGTIGGAIFERVEIGWIVLVSHYLGAIINGLIFRKRKRTSQINVKISSNDAQNALSNAISKATINMLYVGGYIVLCGMIADTFDLIGISSAIDSLPHDLSCAIKSVLYGAVEMTRGIIQSANCSNVQLATLLCTTAVSFGGLSITLQNYTFLSKCDVSMFSILARKITQCLISALIAFVLSLLL